jgi:hypothetical protein
LSHVFGDSVFDFQDDIEPSEEEDEDSEEEDNRLDELVAEGNDDDDPLLLGRCGCLGCFSL